MGTLKMFSGRGKNDKDVTGSLGISTVEGQHVPPRHARTHTHTTTATTTTTTTTTTATTTTTTTTTNTSTHTRAACLRTLCCTNVSQDTQITSVACHYNYERIHRQTFVGDGPRLCGPGHRHIGRTFCRGRSGKQCYHLDHSHNLLPHHVVRCATAREEEEEEEEEEEREGGWGHLSSFGRAHNTSAHTFKHYTPMPRAASPKPRQPLPATRLLPAFAHNTPLRRSRGSPLPRYTTLLPNACGVSDTRVTRHWNTTGIPCRIGIVTFFAPASQFISMFGSIFGDLLEQFICCLACPPATCCTRATLTHPCCAMGRWGRSLWALNHCNSSTRPTQSGRHSLNTAVVLFHYRHPGGHCCVLDLRASQSCLRPLVWRPLPRWRRLPCLVVRKTCAHPIPKVPLSLFLLFRARAHTTPLTHSSPLPSAPRRSTAPFSTFRHISQKGLALSFG